MGETSQIEAEAYEVEGSADAIPAEPIRHLPEPVRNGRALAPPTEVRTAALAAAGGLVAGMATVAVVRAARGPSKKAARRKAARPNFLASRSFQVDIHLLGNR